MTLTDAGLAPTPPNVPGSPPHSATRSRRVGARAVVGALLALAVLVLAVVGPLLAPENPSAFVGRIYEKPSSAHPLGTDVLGRDVLSRLLVGGGDYMAEGMIAAVLGVGIGALLGIAIGIAGRRSAAILLFLSDGVMVIPQILLVLTILAAFGATAVTLTIAVAAAQVTYTARVVSAATRRVTGQDYYRSARAIGSRGLVLIGTEVLPNVAGVVLVEFGVRLSVCFVALASLSYLGFSSGGAEWGGMVHDNQGGIAVNPWAALAPVAVIAVFLIGVNLVRDAVARRMARMSAL